MERVRILLLYSLSGDSSSFDNPLLHIKVCPDCDELDDIALFHMPFDGNIERHVFFPQSHLFLQLQVGDDATVVIEVRNHDYVRAGGIWQVRWQQDVQGYVLFEVCSHLIQMVYAEQVEEQMPEQEMVLMGQAVFEVYDRLEELDPQFLVPISFVKTIDSARTEATTSEDLSEVAARERRWQVLVFEQFPNILPKYRRFEVVSPPGEEKPALTSRLLSEWEA